MRITILTLFPEMFESVFASSIVGRARANGVVSIDFVQIRDFAPDTYKHVDDTPFGGGAGMVMKCQPVLDALASVRGSDSYCISLTPGAVFSSDAFYEGDDPAWKKLSKLGVTCVEMETFALYLNAAEAGKEALSLLTISDSLVTGESLPAMARQTSFTDMIRLALEIA